MTDKNRNEELQKQLQEITDRLEQGVRDVFTSENYKKYLSAMSRFHNYSLNNILLIAMQKPDATLIAGYTAWKKLHGRQVMRGERGIKILAPAPYTVKRDITKTDPITQKPVIGEDGRPETEEREVVIPAYKIVSVFDVSQTEGKEIPTLGINELTGDIKDYDTFFKALCMSCPVQVSFEKISTNAKGYFSHAENRIAVKEGMSQMQIVKTTLHEMAHQKLHSGQEQQDRSTKEIEAESVAYVVCQHYGIDTSDYSFSYVAGWSEGKEIPELRDSLDTVRKASLELIYSIDTSLEEINYIMEAKRSVAIDTDKRPSLVENLHRKQEQVKARDIEFPKTGIAIMSQSVEKDRREARNSGR